jgi:hypothetical protein
LRNWRQFEELIVTSKGEERGMAMSTRTFNTTRSENEDLRELTIGEMAGTRGGGFWSSFFGVFELAYEGIASVVQGKSN